VGDIIVTNLNNLGMPFIRYSIGDEGSLWEGMNCPCGRASPKIKTVEGRITEMFRTRDGRLVRAAFSGGFQCLAHPTINQFQVLQKSLDHMIVRLIPEGQVPQYTLDEIEQAFRTTFGQEVEVDFEFLAEIPPLPSGKHQYAFSELNRSTGEKGSNTVTK
jgi:phenylacetate-CoA ligase